jgi:hypothetical protein
VLASGLAGRLVNKMGDSRKWSVESKDFEMSIKGGNLGVRIVERKGVTENRDQFLFIGMS